MYVSKIYTETCFKVVTLLPIESNTIKFYFIFNYVTFCGLHLSSPLSRYYVCEWMFVHIWNWNVLPTAHVLWSVNSTIRDWITLLLPVAFREPLQTVYRVILTLIRETQILADIETHRQYSLLLRFIKD